MCLPARICATVQGMYDKLQVGLGSLGRLRWPSRPTCMAAGLALAASTASLPCCTRGEPAMPAPAPAADWPSVRFLVRGAVAKPASPLRCRAPAGGAEPWDCAKAIRALTALQPGHVPESRQQAGRGRHWRQRLTERRERDELSCRNLSRLAMQTFPVAESTNSRQLFARPGFPGSGIEYCPSPCPACSLTHRRATLSLPDHRNWTTSLSLSTHSGGPRALGSCRNR